MKGVPASLCPPLQLCLTLYAGLHWPFGNCFSCLRCLAVAPICSDCMHTEWTCYETGWLSLTNSLWHQPPTPTPPATIFFLGACCFLTVILLEPVENLIHLVTRTDVQLAVCLGSMRQLNKQLSTQSWTAVCFTRGGLHKSKTQGGHTRNAFKHKPLESIHILSCHNHKFQFIHLDIRWQTHKSCPSWIGRKG